ncbi:ABC transporter substrate-binding protein [Herpetosiphon llansteffanensis]
MGLLALLALTACGAPAAQPTATTAPVPTATTAPVAVAPTSTSESKPAGTFSITDGTGTTLSFEQSPAKIICLYKRCTEVLASLGVIPQALPASMAELAKDASYFSQPNQIVLLRETNDEIGFDLEELAALKPDLILGWEELRTSMNGIAQVYAVTNDMNSYQDSHAETRAFAALLGREAEAETAINAFLDRLEAYKRLSPKDRSVMYIFFYDDKVYYRDGDSATCALLNEVAGCAWPDPAKASSWSVETSIEGLLALNPDMIIVDSYGLEAKTNDELRASVGKNPLWQELAAYKEQRLLLQPVGIHSMDGMGTVGAARLLDTYMPLLYPETFPQPLTEEAIKAGQ